jgi:prefoldin subunit 5
LVAIVIAISTFVLTAIESNNTINTLESKIEQGGGDLTQFQNDMNKALEKIRTDIGEIQRFITQNSVDILNLQSSVSTVQTNITIIQSDVKTTQGDITTLNTGLATTNSTVTTLGTTVTRNNEVLTTRDDVLTRRVDINARSTPVTIDFNLLSLPPVITTEYIWNNTENQAIGTLGGLQVTELITPWDIPGKDLPTPNSDLGITYNPLNDGVYQTLTPSTVKMVSEIVPIQTTIGVQVVRLQNQSSIADDLALVAMSSDKQVFQEQLSRFWARHPIDTTWGNAPVQLPNRIGELLHNYPENNNVNKTRITLSYLRENPYSQMISSILGAAAKLLNFIPGMEGTGKATYDYLDSGLSRFPYIELLFKQPFKTAGEMNQLPYSTVDGFVMRDWNSDGLSITVSATELVEYVTNPNRKLVNDPPNGGRTIENTIRPEGDTIYILEGEWVDGVKIGRSYQVRLRTTQHRTPMIVQFPYTHFYGDSIAGRGIGVTNKIGSPGLVTGVKTRGLLDGDGLIEAPWAYAQYKISMSIPDDDGLIDITGNPVRQGWNCILLGGSISDPVYPPEKDYTLTNMPPVPGWGTPVAGFSGTEWKTFPHQMMNMNV